MHIADLKAAEDRRIAADEKRIADLQEAEEKRVADLKAAAVELKVVNQGHANFLQGYMTNEANNKVTHELAKMFSSGSSFDANSLEALKYLTKK